MTATLPWGVPIAIRKRGRRKVVLPPHGSRHDSGALRCQQIGNAMVKALARAFRRQEMLVNGTFDKEMAVMERINESYVSRVLLLTLLAPEIDESILDGGKSPQMTSTTLMDRMPIAWRDQRAAVGRR